jgi:hypothetical protein
MNVNKLISSGKNQVFSMSECHQIPDASLRKQMMDFTLIYCWYGWFMNHHIECKMRMRAWHGKNDHDQAYINNHAGFKNKRDREEQAKENLNSHASHIFAGDWDAWSASLPGSMPQEGKVQIGKWKTWLAPAKTPPLFLRG